MFTNRISQYLEDSEPTAPKQPKTGFAAIPGQMIGRAQAFTSAQELYRYAYECAKAELLSKLVALLRSRWDLIHVTDSDLSV